MKLYDLSLVIIACIVVVSAVVGITSITYLGEHNPLEKESEKVIQDETGLNVDLDYKDYIKSTK